MPDSADKPLYEPLVEGRLRTMMTIRKDLKAQIEASIQKMRDDAAAARERTEKEPKYHGSGSGSG